MSDKFESMYDCGLFVVLGDWGGDVPPCRCWPRTSWNGLAFWNATCGTGGGIGRG